MGTSNQLIPFRALLAGFQTSKVANILDNNGQSGDDSSGLFRVHLGSNERRGSSEQK